MPLTYSKQLPSGSTNGRMIEVNATASPGTTIHTVVATTTDAREEVYLWAQNASTSSESILTVEYGGTGTEDQIVYPVPAADGLYQITPGAPLTATTSIVRAFATATGVLRILGAVNRAT